MKKVFAAVMCALILVGCGSLEADLPQRVLTQLETISEQSLSIGNNHKKKYYSYYLPAGMGRRDSNELSEVFTKDGYRMIMNFDPSAIVIKNYYTQDEEDAKTAPTPSSDLLAQFLEPKMEQSNNNVVYTGNYMTSSREIFPYTLQLSKNDHFYLLYFDGTIVKLYTYVPAAAVPSSLKAMILLSSSLDYEEDKILEDYSMKSLENTNQNNLDFLEQHMPSSGSLEELLNPEIDHGASSDMPE